LTQSYAPSPLLHLRTQYMTLADATSEALQRAILSGKFPPGSQLPPELDLIDQLGVSRTTLREALKRLEEQGLIFRRRGRGTYVRERSIVKDLSLNFGISEMITQAGFTPGVRSAVLRREPARPRWRWPWPSPKVSRWWWWSVCAPPTDARWFGRAICCRRPGSTRVA